MSQGIVEAGLAYGRRDFSVLSVWSTNAGVCRCPDGATCRTPGKHPIPPDGFKSATRDPDRIEAMLSAPSEPNIGIVPPEGVFGWDIDGPGLARLDELERWLGTLPDTMTTKTANGMHLFFRWPDDQPRPDGNVFGFVTRWGGSNATGYLIGAGSRHASGFIYQTMRDGHDRQSPIAMFPPAWVTAAQAYRPPISVSANGVPEKVPEGARHGYLRDKARHFRGQGLTGDALFAAVMALNIARCDPPKDAEDVRRAIGEAETKFTADPIAIPNSTSTPEPASWIRLPPAVWTPAPARLIEPFVCDSRTYVFGAGNTGKSVLVAFIVAAFAGVAEIPDASVTTPLRMGIVDYEDNEDEWADRLARIGLAPGSVPYLAPRLPVGADLANIAAWIDGEGVDAVAIDSGLAAAGGVDAMAPETPLAYYRALRELERPSLTIFHVPKTAAASEHPFGSVYWSNGARLGWRAERLDTLSGHVVKLTNTRHNRWEKAPVTVLRIGWEAGRITLASALNLTPSVPLTDRVTAALLANGRPMTSQALATVLGVIESTVRSTLERNPERFRKVGETLAEFAKKAAALWDVAETVQ